MIDTAGHVDATRHRIAAHQPALTHLLRCRLPAPNDTEDMINQMAAPAANTVPICEFRRLGPLCGAGVVIHASPPDLSRLENAQTAPAGVPPRHADHSWQLSEAGVRAPAT
ncbi:MAG: hypothetical protein ABWZ02_03955 [Nakamurella sp.]